MNKDRLTQMIEFLRDEDNDFDFYMEDTRRCFIGVVHALIHGEQYTEDLSIDQRTHSGGVWEWLSAGPQSPELTWKVFHGMMFPHTEAIHVSDPKVGAAALEYFRDTGQDGWEHLGYVTEEELA